MSPFSDRPVVVLPRGLAPVGYRNFALFLAGYVASNTGRWMELTGAVWIVSELTDSPVVLGLLGLSRAIPGIILSPWAGVVSDRVDQRRLLFATQASSLVASLVLGLLIAIGRVELWHVFVQVAIQSAIGAFDASVRQALFPRLVPRRHLGEAVTLHSTAGRLAQLVGPAVGGLLIAGFGSGAPFLVNAATYFVLMAAILGMRGVIPRVAQRGSTMRGELVEGFRYLWDAPLLSGLFRLEIAFGLFQVNAVIITIIGRELLGVGPEGLGILLSAGALGALAGVAGLIAFGQPSRQGRFIIVSQLAYAAFVLAVAVSGTFWLTFACLVCIGFVDALATVTRHNVMQLAAPSHMRGRLMANMGTVTRGTTPLSQATSGTFVGILGPVGAIVASAAALALAAGSMAWLNPTLWHFRREDLATDPTDDRVTTPEDAPR